MFARLSLSILFGLLLATASAAISQTAFAQDANDGVLPPGTNVPRAPSIQGPVPVSGQWIEFAVGQTGSFATGCQPADPAGPSCTPSSAGNSVFGDAPPWTFTAPPQGATLTVTDAFMYGGTFEVFDFGVSIGTTPSVPVGGGTCGDNPDVCLTDPLSSHGVFTLKGGPHQITIKAALSPIGGAAAYFRVDPGELKPDHFVCYKVTAKGDKDRKHHDKHEKLQVLITNQFGEQVLAVDDPELLCVPSTKVVIEPTELKGGEVPPPQ